MTKAFRIHRMDNVATLLSDAEAGPVECVGEGPGTILLRGGIKLGHKVALSSINVGGAVIKYGVRIGHTTREIMAGEWVHLHNCASDYDERSNQLDHETGAPNDSADAYA